MNEILKFKLGRKIRKAQDGTKTYYEVTERPKITVTKGGEESLGMYNRRIYNGKWTWGLYDGEGNFTPITKQVTLNNGTILNTNGSKSSVGARNAVKNAKVIERGYMDANGNKTPLDAAPLNAGGNAGSRPAVRRTGTNWGNEFTNFMSGLSQDQQNWLKQNGLDNAKALQTYLDANNYYDSTGNNVDNKFGGNSKAAWNRFVASGNMGKNRDLEILAEKLKEVRPVIDAPDPFGYESKGNYALDNARTLKTNGIRDWTTMLNYIKGNQESAFAQDMMHRFGSDLSKWNQKDVESAMGVSGHYGRNDRSRIQGFMAGNLANWNNQRQTAINDYAKKTFLKNQAGMNTLGDAGAGTMAQLDVNNMSERLKFAMGV